MMLRAHYLILDWELALKNIKEDIQSVRYVQKIELI